MQEIIDQPGLRIVMVQGMPSPWAQAAKTIFEIKGLEYGAAPWVPGAANEKIAKWGGETSATLVAWAREKPIFERRSPIFCEHFRNPMEL